MANKFRGITWNNARFGPKIQVRRSIDLAELGDFGSIIQATSDLPTRGAAHRADHGGSTSATRGHTDLRGISGQHSNVVDTQDMGLITDATTTHRIWSSTGAITDVVTEAPTTLYNPGSSGSGDSGGDSGLDLSSISLAHTRYGFGDLDRIGTGVGVTEDYIVTGAAQIGKVYIWDANTYDLIHTLQSSDTNNTHSRAQFGRDIRICGTNNDKALVTSEYAYNWGNGNAHIIDLATGQVEYNLYNNGQWGNPSTGMLSASGNYATVGDDDNGGKLQVFDVSTGNSVNVFTDPNYSGSGASNGFGRRSATTSQYLVASAPYTQASDGSNDSGEVHVFDIAAGTLSYTITNPNNTTSKYQNQFGQEVGANDDYIVAATRNTASYGGGPLGTGAPVVYVYNTTDGSLVKTIDDLPTDARVQKMVITDSVLAVTTSQSDVWKIRLYNTSDFSHSHTIDNPETREGIANDWFGRSMDVYESSGELKLVASSPYVPNQTGQSNTGVWYAFE